jgi:hypothetical protein
MPWWIEANVSSMSGLLAVLALEFTFLAEVFLLLMGLGLLNRYLPRRASNAARIPIE